MNFFIVYNALETFLEYCYTTLVIPVKLALEFTQNSAMKKPIKYLFLEVVAYMFPKALSIIPL